MSHPDPNHFPHAARRRFLLAWLFVFALAVFSDFATAGGTGSARIQVSATGSGRVTPPGGVFPIGSAVTFTATPADGFVFSQWTDETGAPLALDADRPALSYTVAGRAVLNARFIRHPFYRFAGTVNGWIRTFTFTPSSGIPAATSRGLFTLSLTKTGGFSGRLIFDGETFPLQGAMSGLGQAHLRLAKADGTLLRVEMTLSLEDPASSLEVAVIGDGYCALGSVAVTGAPVLAPRNSVVLSPAAEGATIPFGNLGYASLVRDTAGAYRGIGALGDGTRVSFSGRFIRDHLEGVVALPIHARLSDGGWLAGLLDFATTRGPGERIGGTLQRQPAPALARNSTRTTAAGKRAFVSTGGNDANTGSRAAPLRSTQAALASIGGEGEIVLLAGDYEGEKLDLATARKVTIRSEAGQRVRVFLGEKRLGAAFTHHSGNIWKTNLSTIVPQQGTEGRFWIFEMKTSEGEIEVADRRARQGGRAWRLDHRRLVQASSMADVDSSDGRYFVSDGTLYLRTASGTAPAPDQEFRIPSQSESESFVFGATSQCDITVEGIEVYFGLQNLNFTRADRYTVRGCKLFGAGFIGILAKEARFGLEEHCEYAANADDGVSCFNGSSTPFQVTVLDAWSHDNGDEGHSIHNNSSGVYFGGLFEFNTNGGITPAISASAVIVGSRTQGNFAGISPTVEPAVHVLVARWTSSGDRDGLQQWTSGLATVVDARVLNTQRYSFVGVVAAARIHVFNTQITGGLGMNAGAGAAGTIFQNGRAEIGWDAAVAGSDLLDLQGSSHWPPRRLLRMEPFGLRAPNGRIEIEELDGLGLPVSVLNENFTLEATNAVTVSGANPQALRLVIDPLTGVFTGTYRDRSAIPRTLGGIMLQERRLGWGHSPRSGASDVVKISPL